MSISTDISLRPFISSKHFSFQTIKAYQLIHFYIHFIISMGISSSSYIPQNLPISLSNQPLQGLSIIPSNYIMVGPHMHHFLNQPTTINSQYVDLSLNDPNANSLEHPYARVQVIDEQSSRKGNKIPSYQEYKKNAFIDQIYALLTQQNLQDRYLYYVLGIGIEQMFVNKIDTNKDYKILYEIWLKYKIKQAMQLDQQDNLVSNQWSEQMQALYKQFEWNRYDSNYDQLQRTYCHEILLAQVYGP